MEGIDLLTEHGLMSVNGLLKYCTLSKILVVLISYIDPIVKIPL